MHDAAPWVLAACVLIVGIVCVAYERRQQGHALAVVRQEVASLVADSDQRLSDQVTETRSTVEGLMSTNARLLEQVLDLLSHDDQPSRLDTERND